MGKAARLTTAAGLLQGDSLGGRVVVGVVMDWDMQPNTSP